MKYTFKENLLGGVVFNELGHLVEGKELVETLNNQEDILKVAEKIIRQHLSEAHVNEYRVAKQHILFEDLPEFEPKNCRCRISPLE